MINVALPSIMHYFSCTFNQCQWVVVVYLLTITISLLLWGHLSDRLGKGKIYLLGMFVFAVGSSGCGFSYSLVQLIFFRFVQAVGAAMMMSTGPAIITHVFGVQYLGRALGLIGVATSAGLMSGPVVSGFLLHHFGWRAIFFVTIPVSLFVSVAGYYLVLPTLSLAVISRRIPFDWKSFLCWSLLIIFVVLLSSNHLNLKGGVVVWYLVGAVVTAVMFITVERKSNAPLLPHTLLKRKYFTVAMVTAVLSFSVLFMVIILIPFYLTLVLRLTTIEIGTVMMTLPVTLSIVSPLSGRLYDAIGAKKLTTSGMLVCAAATFLLSLLATDSGTVDVMWRLAMLGMGQAIFLSPNSASVLSRVKDKYVGITSGLLATSRNLGMLFGVAMAGMVFGFFFDYFSGGFDLNGFQAVHTTAFISSLHFSLLMAATISFVGAMISSLR